MGRFFSVLALSALALAQLAGGVAMLADNLLFAGTVVLASGCGFAYLADMVWRDAK